MTNLQLFLIGGVTAYLLYVNMHHEKNIQSIELPDHVKADITQRSEDRQEKKPIKEHIPFIADERPKPPKPIAIPVVESPITKIQYHPTQGWINWDLMHNLAQPKFRTFQSKTYM